jgi:hypothetical protein
MQWVKKTHTGVQGIYSYNSRMTSSIRIATSAMYLAHKPQKCYEIFCFRGYCALREMQLKFAVGQK